MLDFFAKGNIIKIKNYYYICFGMKEHRIERSFSHEQKFEGNQDRGQSDDRIRR